jgi:hypothetical protein
MKLGYVCSSGTTLSVLLDSRPKFLQRPKRVVHRFGNALHKAFVGNAMDTSSTVTF